jgi:hypothetical protein
MRRFVIAGFLVVLSVSGCASMKGGSPNGEPHAAQVPIPPASTPQSIPPPAVTPPSKAEPPANNGSDKPPPVSPPTRTSPAKAKPSPEPRLDKQAEGAAEHTGAPTPHIGPPKTPPASAPASTPIASPTLNLADLEQRLRETRAIGVFSKLSLKNQVDDLLNAFRALYRGPNKHPTAELRQRYDLLLLKVLTLLQDGDPPLAAAISSSREAIWSILADPDKFAKI